MPIIAFWDMPVPFFVRCMHSPHATQWKMADFASIIVEQVLQRLLVRFWSPLKSLLFFGLTEKRDCFDRRIDRFSFSLFRDHGSWRKDPRVNIQDWNYSLEIKIGIDENRGSWGKGTYGLSIPSERHKHSLFASCTPIRSGVQFVQLSNFYRGLLFAG